MDRTAAIAGLGAAAAFASALQALQPARTVTLEGAANFRDVGGYRNDQWKRVRWGRLFRSGSLANLTNADAKLLGSAQRLRVQVDMEGAVGKELGGQTTDVATNWRRVPIDLDESTTSATPVGRNAPPTPTTAQSFLVAIKQAGSDRSLDRLKDLSLGKFYVSLLYYSRPKIKQVMRVALGPANHPIVIHCVSTHRACPVLSQQLPPPSPSCLLRRRGE